MIEIHLGARERELIREWIDHVQRQASLFGDDPIVFPDEEIVRKKLGEENPLRFTRYHLECVRDWGEASPVCTEEKFRLLEKIKVCLKAAGPETP